MVSIIIPTFNEERFLPSILECLSQQNLLNMQIIISDAFSTDKTRLIAKSFGASIVNGGKPAIGRNNGAKIAKYDTLIFLDADNTFDNNFILSIFNEFKNRKLDIASCYYNLKKVKNIKYKLFLKMFNLGQYIFQYTPTPQTSSQVMIFKKEIFDKLEGFNEKIKLIEDIEILKRARQSKFKFRLINSVKYYPSVRRFDKYGVIRPALAGIIGSILVYTNNFKESSQNFVQKIYGGWGF